MTDNSPKSRDATILYIQTLQESVKDLFQRLDTVKTQYEAGQAENEMLVKYIQNLKATTTDIRSGK